MKILTVILFVYLSSLVLSQEPVNDSLGGRIVWREQAFIEKQEKEKQNFPAGYSPDGKIGTFNLVILGGKLSQSDNYSGFAFNGTLEFIIHESLTMFITGQYQELTYSGSAPVFFNINSKFLGGGIKIFAGM